VPVIFAEECFLVHKMYSASADLKHNEPLLQREAHASRCNVKHMLHVATWSMCIVHDNAATVTQWRRQKLDAKAKRLDNCYLHMYTLFKKRPNLSSCMSSPNIDRFSKFLNWHTPWTICNNVIAKYPTTHWQRRYITLWNMNVRKTNYNRQHALW